MCELLNVVVRCQFCRAEIRRGTYTRCSLRGTEKPGIDIQCKEASPANQCVSKRKGLCSVCKSMKPLDDANKLSAGVKKVGVKNAANQSTDDEALTKIAEAWAADVDKAVEADKAEQSEQAEKAAMIAEIDKIAIMLEDNSPVKAKAEKAKNHDEEKQDHQKVCMTPTKIRETTIHEVIESAEVKKEHEPEGQDDHGWVEVVEYTEDDEYDLCD